MGWRDFADIFKKNPDDYQPTEGRHRKAGKHRKPKLCNSTYITSSPKAGHTIHVCCAIPDHRGQHLCGINWKCNVRWLHVMSKEKFFQDQC